MKASARGAPCPGSWSAQCTVAAAVAATCNEEEPSTPTHGQLHAPRQRRHGSDGPLCIDKVEVQAHDIHKAEPKKATRDSRQHNISPNCASQRAAGVGPRAPAKSQRNSPYLHSQFSPVAWPPPPGAVHQVVVASLIQPGRPGGRGQNAKAKASALDPEVAEGGEDEAHEYRPTERHLNQAVPLQAQVTQARGASAPARRHHEVVGEREVAAGSAEVAATAKATAKRKNRWRKSQLEESAAQTWILPEQRHSQHPVVQASPPSAATHHQRPGQQGQYRALATGGTSCRVLRLSSPAAIDDKRPTGLKCSNCSTAPAPWAREGAGGRTGHLSQN
eukprot:CAMPEP_0168378034 /NCGR_PEP_ID=MMETSP0228-20121227/11132_1 /TAXON_ID=133427 /ORGANISM="Protoceratium reticulatum, Strain CCCM 535 (=CCMP 1889)" /LENGTH=332 /DNA_ID=CAMNT_0008391047 /DNA_START=304 /DNA_END=1302 /DNA_ORIENTATION=+